LYYIIILYYIISYLILFLKYSNIFYMLNIKYYIKGFMLNTKYFNNIRLYTHAPNMYWRNWDIYIGYYNYFDTKNIDFSICQFHKLRFVMYCKMVILYEDKKIYV